MIFLCFIIVFIVIGFVFIPPTTSTMFGCRPSNRIVSPKVIEVGTPTFIEIDGKWYTNDVDRNPLKVEKINFEELRKRHKVK